MPSSIQNLLFSCRLRQSLHRSTEAFLRSVGKFSWYRISWSVRPVKFDSILRNFNSNFNIIMRRKGNLKLIKNTVWRILNLLKLFSAAPKQTVAACQTCESTGGTCYSDANDALACGCPVHYRATNGLTDGCDQIYGEYAPSNVPQDHGSFPIPPSTTLTRSSLFILQRKRCLCGSILTQNARTTQRPHIPHFYTS
jgi:hypothetical protein